MSIQWTLARRYLLGRKLRTVLTTLAVAFGVAVIFGMSGMAPAMVRAYRQNLLTAVGQVDLTVTHVTGGVFGPDVVETVRSTPGIAQATGLLRRNALLPTPLGKEGDPLGAVSILTVSGIDPQTALQVRSYAPVAGRFLEVGDRDAVVIQENLAQLAGLSVGDTLVLPAAAGTAGFTIVGIVAAPPLAGTAEVYVPLAAAQALFGQAGQINTVEALYAAGAEPGQVRAALQERLGDSYELGQMEAGQELLAALQIWDVAFSAFGLMALAMGAFIIFNTFRTVVAERRRDIGLLRAVGASRRTVLGIILTESLLQGLLGSALGILTGFALSTGLLAAVGPIIRQFLHTDMGAPSISLLSLVEAVLLGVGATLASGLIPALSASRVTPLEALRPPVGSAYERASRRRALVGAALIVLASAGLFSGIFNLAALGTLLFLAGLVLAAPALVRPVAQLFGRLLDLFFAREGRIAQGNMSRQPGRAAITASALMIALAIVVALFGVVFSIRGAFLNYLDRSLGADFLLLPPSFVLGGGNVGAGPDLATGLRQAPGIAAVTTLRLSTAQSDSGALQVIGIDPQTYPVVAGLQFKEGDPAQAYAALGSERAIIVNGIFSALHGLKPGDVLHLTTPAGRRDYRVVGIGLDYMNAKLAAAYISQANLAEDFHQTSDVLLMANMAPGADAAAVRNSLEALVRGYPSFTLVDAVTFHRTQEQTFESMFVFLYMMVVVLALPGLIAMVNTLAINVIERTREIGMLRAVGSTQRQVRRMILAESLLLALLGIVLGVLAGLWLGYFMVGAMDVAGFVVSYYFPAAGVLMAVVVGLGFGLLAATLPARQAARMQIVQALRYE